MPLKITGTLNIDTECTEDADFEYLYSEYQNILNIYFGYLFIISLFIIIYFE